MKLTTQQKNEHGHTLFLRAVILCLLGSFITGGGVVALWSFSLSIGIVAITVGVSSLVATFVLLERSLKSQRS